MTTISTPSLASIQREKPRCASVRMAYLISQYPAISHTFILREINYLKNNNNLVYTASINAPDRPVEQLTTEEQLEANNTFYIKKAGIWAALKSHLRGFTQSPRTYTNGLRYAIGLAGFDLKKMLWNTFYFTEALMLTQWMQRNTLDHLHVHFATAASTVALIARQLYSFGFSFTAHGPDEFYQVDHYHLSEKIAAADFVCCIGSFARSQLMKLSDPLHWDKFEISPLGVDLDRFAARPTPQETNEHEIICVGRLVPAKGQRILIEACARLIRCGRPIHLRLVGDGPDRIMLEQTVQEWGLNDRIHFEGAVNQDRIRALYERADIFALASFAEGIPVVLMEAMAMEIPCVTTRITGIPELIRDGQDGLLVAPSDSEDLARAIARLLDDKDLRQRIGQQGRLRVGDKYHLAHNTEHLRQIFHRRVGQPTQLKAQAF